MAMGQGSPWQPQTCRVSVPLLIAIVFVVVLTLSAMPASATDYAIRPPAAWVEQVAAGSADDGVIDQISNGEYVLLADQQVRLTAADRTTFRRYVSKAISAQGVQEIANVRVPFDPSYQRLELHWIDVIRDGKVQHRLPTATVRVLQQETELERRIYDGSKTANVFLDDVRAGDSVDYAYTVTGRNPVFGGRDFGSISQQYGVPAARLHARLLAHASKPLRFFPRNGAASASIRESGGLRDYRWTLDQVPALVKEDGSPGWYSPWPVVQWSEFADWQAVARWASPLYQLPARLDPALQAEVDRIARAEPTAHGRLLAALRFSQGEIRYLGVEIGAGSHAPNPPTLVLQRRFGDCKDKSLLLLTLLDRLGIDARAALVNTEVRRGLIERQPSPGQFDHVIVQARLDGRSYWLDPTRSRQNADLDRLYQPDFGHALIIDPGSRGLVPMRNGEARPPMREIRGVFDAKAGFDQPVELTVVSTLEGARAENLRYALASTSFAETGKKYLNYYATYYPGLVNTAALQVVDDETANRIVSTERYRIPEFASYSEAELRHNGEIALPDTVEPLRAPASSVRRSPLAVEHPVDFRVVTEVLLPQDWNLEAETYRVDDPAFSYTRDIVPKVDRLVITDHYRSLADEVAAVDVPRYAANLAKARGYIGYQVSWTDPAKPSTATGLERVNWLQMMVLVGSAGFWIWLVARVWRFDPAPPGRVVPSLRGLGGWLLLVGFGIVISPLLVVKAMVEALPAWSMDVFSIVTTPGSAGYHALWAPSLLFELFSHVGLLVTSLLMVVLFFQRRSSLPRVYIVMMIATVLQQIASLSMLSAIPAAGADLQDFSAVVGSAFTGVIWCLYFAKSERVSSTFRRRRDGTEDVPDVSTAGMAAVEQRPQTWARRPAERNP